ncbi:hypothetical protein NG895_18595 [Aeoliella sp. ICT_H6.2]|uniref:Uncharacterized protein n=1 Tax=Aeoliella straminimaris TaxID=2954799 RepID=A0A9X2JIP4_9BACT|nr:hypothetical protein [Aeoliella straminimaris]MCO6045913.1 hypothetical protein [Aeoliella straminimaris]
MADKSPLSKALDQAAEVFDLAYSLGRQFQQEHHLRRLGIIVEGKSLRDQNLEKINEFITATLNARDLIENPPDVFEAIAEQLRKAAQHARDFQQLGESSVAEQWDKLIQIAQDGYLAVEQAIEAMWRDGPRASSEESPGGVNQESERTPAAAGGIPDPPPKSEAPIFTGDLHQLHSLSDWIHDFERASVCRVDGYDPDSEFDVDYRKLNAVLAHGSEHLGCLNIVEAQKLSQLIAELQLDTACLIAGGLEAAVDPSADFLAAYRSLNLKLAKATTYIRWLGHSTRDELRSIESAHETTVQTGEAIGTTPAARTGAAAEATGTKPKPEYPNPPTYARDKWLYENIESCSFTDLQLKLKQVAKRERFVIITSRPGIKKAADRYATFHQLPVRRFPTNSPGA